MTAHIQQNYSTVSALQHLSVKLQQLTSSLTLPQSVSAELIPSSDASNLIAQVETALVSLQVEHLHQQALSLGIWDFFPTPNPVIDKSRLVTVAHHYHLKPSATDRAFFRWLNGFDACFYDCGRAFELGYRPCSIPIQLIVLNKPRW